jgi:hypothetical protein
LLSNAQIRLFLRLCGDSGFNISALICHPFSIAGSGSQLGSGGRLLGGAAKVIPLPALHGES